MSPAQLTSSTQPPSDTVPHDSSQLIAIHTTVEEVRDRLPKFHELPTAAAVDGPTALGAADQAGKARAVEGKRRQTLVTDTRFGT
jgi:hypothetical protein